MAPFPRIALQRRWAPPLGAAQIDWTHPLAQRLACLTVGSTEMVGGASMTSTDATKFSPTGGASPFGPGPYVVSQATSQAVQFNAPARCLSVTSDFSMVVAMSRPTATTVGYAPLLAFMYSGSFVSPYGLLFRNITNVLEVAMPHAGPSFTSVQSGVSAVSAGNHVYGVSRIGSSVSFWADGALVETKSSVSTALAWSGLTAEFLGQSGVASQYHITNSVIPMTGLWSRALSASEMAALWADPFAMLR